VRLERTGSPLHGADLHTAVAAACLEALQRLHRAGWVHGDTHLGNFLLDVGSWRVYLIDFERAFPCSLQRQAFLDVQELFGHMSGALVSYPYTHSWDMTEILPIVTRLHPALSTATPHYPDPQAFRLLAPSPLPEAHTRSEQRRRLFHLLPVCTCFVHSDRRQRLEGCEFCTSHFNRLNIQYYFQGAAAVASAAAAEEEEAKPPRCFNQLCLPAPAAPLRCNPLLGDFLLQDDDSQELDDEDEHGHPMPPCVRRQQPPQPPQQHPQRFIDALFDVSLPRIADMVSLARTALRLEYRALGECVLQNATTLRPLLFGLERIDLARPEGRRLFGDWFVELIYGAALIDPVPTLYCPHAFAEALRAKGLPLLARSLARITPPHYYYHYRAEEAEAEAGHQK
jgi:hypothetical protein